MRRLFLLLFFVSVCNVCHSVQAQSASDSVNIYVQNFQFHKALSYIDKQNPISKDLLFKKAMCHKSLGDLKQSITILRKLAKDYPKDVQINIELATCYEQDLQLKDGAVIYDNLLKIDSTNLYFMTQKAMIEFKRQNYGTSIKQLKHILAKDSMQSALNLIGKSFEHINQLDSAITYYNVAWAKDSTDSYAAANLINSHLKDKSYVMALDISNHYLEHNVPNRQIQMLNGYCYYALSEYEQSIIKLENCYMQGDSSLVVTRSIGMSYYYLNDVECAYQYLSKAYKMDTTNNTILYHLAVLCNDLGKHEEANQKFTTHLQRLIPSDLNLYLNYRGLAIANDSLANYQEASSAYLKALEYATTSQRMYLFYDLAVLNEEKLDSTLQAIMYYKQYKSALNGHLLYIKDLDPSDLNSVEELTKKIEALDAHIIMLENKPPKEDNFFMIEVM